MMQYIGLTLLIALIGLSWYGCYKFLEYLDDDDISMPWEDDWPDGY